MRLPTGNKFAFTLLFSLLVAFSFRLPAQFYNGSQIDFGKNRVQYRNFIWSVFKFEKYETYFNVGGREIAVYTARSAKKYIDEIEKLLDHSTEEKIQFIVYNKYEDYRQSNIGLEGEAQYNVGGVTHIVGRKVFIYFDGDHRKLDEQIRAGIAEVLLNDMMYGGDLKDVLKNSTLLTLPDWYTKGLISYISRKWDTDIDNRVRDGTNTGRYTKFNRLIGQDAVYAGHSIWNYIIETYGEGVVSNILYMTKVSRNVENSFLFVLGVSTRNLSSDWQNYYSSRYIYTDSTAVTYKGTELLKPRKVKSFRTYSQLKVSPDGKYVTYCTNEMGKVKFWLYDIEKNKKRKIMKYGHKLDRINDYTYPVVAWHPSGKLFAYLNEDQGRIFLTFYTLETHEKESRPMDNFEKILDMSYDSDGKKMVFSGVQKGQSDIYIYTIAGNNSEPITKDIYDDLNPRFICGSSKIIFASNRTNDTIRGNVKEEMKNNLPHFTDLFIYDLKTRSNVLKRVTNTPYINETAPTEYEGDKFAYLSDANGVNNRYVAKFDSSLAFVDTSTHYNYFVTSHAVTNYSRSIIEEDVSMKANKLAEVIFSNGKYHMYIRPIDETTFPEQIGKMKNTPYRNETIRMAKADSVAKLQLNKKTVPPVKGETGKKTDQAPPASTATEKITVKVTEYNSPKDTGAVNINKYNFSSSTKKDPAVGPTAKTIPSAMPGIKDTLNPKDSTKAKDDFFLPLQRNYKIQYATEYVVTQLDNSFLDPTYQKFTGGGSPVYLNPGFNGLFKIGMTDLLEDKKIVGGFRLAGDLNSNEYMLSYEDRTQRLDKQYILHRESFLDVSDGGSLLKIHTNEAIYRLKWPFSEVAALRGSVSYRNDQTVYLATDDVNLATPHEYQNWGTGKLEFIFDNVRNRGLNLYNGLRFKLFAEYYKQIDAAATDMTVLGCDFRYYQKIHRDMIWASRFAASTSMGSEKLIYYMGGVDNWFNPQFDHSVRVSTDQNYAFQTLATPVRGFWQNIRNGNNFAVVNNEIRCPIFKYLFARPIRSDFISNFQVIGFGDVGTAWTGDSPYSSQNSLNTTIVGGNAGNPITVILNDHKNPIVGGYGIGLRTRIFGYFVRVDFARGVEDGVIQPRVVYLSLNLDF
jgi:Tol biopolymer transport system component